jgi:hypothetical protein
VILGGITLEEVDALYQRMGVKELFVLPWKNKRSQTYAGMITGAIEHFPEYPGLSAFLEHFIVLPEAENPLAVMQQMPKEAARILRARGIVRILLCIDNAHPKRRGLDAWARRCGYTQYATKDDRNWYVHHLTPQETTTDGQGQSQDAGTRSPAAAAPAAASGPGCAADGPDAR